MRTRDGASRRRRFRLGTLPALVLFTCILASPPATAEETESVLLTIGDAVEEALNHNPSVRAAEARLQAASASLAEAEAGARKGQWQLQGSGSKAKSGVGLPAGPTDYTKSDQLGLGLSWSRTVWQSPVSEAPIEGAASQLASARADSDSARAQAIQQTTDAYFALLQAREGVQIAERRDALAEESLRIVEARLAVGTASEVDRLQAFAEREQAAADLRQARLGEALAERQLLQLLGRPSGIHVRLVDPLEEPDEVLNAAEGALQSFVDSENGTLRVDSERAISLAIANRYEIRAAEAGLAAARLAEEAAVSAGRPVIAAFGNYSWVESGLQLSSRLDRWGQAGVDVSTDATRSDAPGHEDWSTSPETEDTWSVGFQISVSLSDGGAQQARENGARSQVRAALVGLEQLRSGIALEVEAAINGLYGAIGSEEVAAAQREAAEAGLARTEQLREVEASSEVDVLSARLSATAAQMQLNAARRDRMASALKLALTTGWRPELSSTKQPE